MRTLSWHQLKGQLGSNFFAVSGGRMKSTGTNSCSLPVAHGYSVDIRIEANDTYTVERVFTRSGKRIVKRDWTNVYCDQVGEIAYRASCYLDD